MVSITLECGIREAIELVQQGYNRDQIKSQLMGEGTNEKTNMRTVLWLMTAKTTNKLWILEAQKTAFDQKYKSAELGLKQQEMALKDQK